MKQRAEHVDDLSALVVLGLLLTLAFADLLFGGLSLAGRDLPIYHFPLRKIVRDLVMAGHYPVWNPYLEGGQPLAANPAYEVVYPPTWLTFLPGFTFWFKIHILIHFYVAAAGMYALLRTLRASAVPAAISATVFALGGPLISYAGLLPFLFSTAWIPWLYFFAIQYRRTRARGYFVGAAAVLAMQLIIGEPLTVIVAVSPLLIIAVRAREFRAVLAIVIAGIALSAVQVLPAIDHVRDSVRSMPLDFENVEQWSMPLVRPIELFFPHFAGHAEGLYYGGARFYAARGGFPFIASIYLGVLVPALAFAGLILRRRGWIPAALGLAAFYLHAIGSQTPVIHAIAFLHLRYAEKFAVGFLLVLVVFSGCMLQRVLEGDASLGRVATVVLAAATVVSLIFMAAGPRLYTAIWQLPGVSDAFLAAVRRDWLLAALRCGVFAFLLNVLNKQRISKTVALSLLVMGVLADVLPVTLPILLRVPDSYYAQPPTLPGIAPLSRLYHQAELQRPRPYDGLPLDTHQWIVRNDMTPYLPAAWGIPTALEYDIDQTALLATHRLFATAELARRRREICWPRAFQSLANAPYRSEWIALKPADTAHIVNVRFVRDPIAADRYTFARELVHCATEDECITALNAWNEGVALTPGAASEGAPGTVLRVAETPSVIDLDVRSSGNAWLILSVTCHKYWRATVDGVPAALFPANVAFQMMAIPPGEHHVRLVYRNPLLYAGALITLLAIVGLAVRRKDEKTLREQG